MKVEVFAMGANTVLMRIENIADVFDSNGEVIFQEVNVLALATNLFETANNHETFKFGVSIEEVSLTANQSYEAMANRRLKWKTVDDQFDKIQTSEDTGFTRVFFQQQRIRTYQVNYKVE